MVRRRRRPQPSDTPPHTPRPPRGASLAARIEHYLQRTADGCWLWRGPWLESHQAGYLVIGNHKRLAHRIAWELAHGAIPARHRVVRSCAEPRCVNPEHRVLIAHHAAPHATAAPRAAITMCPHGHPYDDDNTLWQRGSRVCRTCHRLRNRERWRRLKHERVSRPAD
jgi:hypothetical protein